LDDAFLFEVYMVVENYEIISVKGSPKALTLAQQDCVGFGRFVSLTQTNTHLSLLDVEGKTLSLAASDLTLPVGEELSVFALFANGQTASQSVVFVE
jgi:hypothetical protein